MANWGDENFEDFEPALTDAETAHRYLIEHMPAAMRAELARLLLETCA
jgi:hypothetical protein